MNRKELTEKIGELNIKILAVNKELEELELNAKRKKIEIRKYKNEISGIQLELEEMEIENWKENKHRPKIKTRIYKEKDVIDDDFYSQEKKFNIIDDGYTNYVKRNVVPYND